jgi:hypothetical protein
LQLGRSLRYPENCISLEGFRFIDG